MRVPSTPRRTGARRKKVHFQYVPTERGQPWEAYIAGPTWWGFLHMLKPSKPCVFELTAGQIACRFCGTGTARVAVEKGWVPLYRRSDGFACMVPVDEVLRDVIEPLPTFTKVVVGKEKGKVVSVFVRPATNQEPKWEHSLPERMEPADVTESLLTVWALPELVSYFSAASDNAVSLTPRDRGEVVAADAGGATSGSEKGITPYVPVGGARPVEVDPILERLNLHARDVKPSTNGKHGGGNS